MRLEPRIVFTTDSRVDVLNDYKLTRHEVILIFLLVSTSLSPFKTVNDCKTIAIYTKLGFGIEHLQLKFL